MKLLSFSLVRPRQKSLEKLAVSATLKHPDLLSVMTFPPRLFLWLACAALTPPSNAQAFLDGLFSGGEEKKVLNAEQMSSQEGAAAGALAKAQASEQSGRQSSARDAYKDIVSSYPRSDSAAEAQFSYARLLEAEGEGRKAFDEYEKLIQSYPNSPHFNEAIQRQFGIAEGFRINNKGGFLGMGAAVQPSKLIEMFEKISKSGPHTEFAPRAKLNIGLVKKTTGVPLEAIAAFRSVVDGYPGTSYATEAQYEIFKIQGNMAEKSNSPIEDRAQVEAGLDFVNQNPEDARANEIKSNLQEIEVRAIEKLYTTGELYEKMGKPDSARVYYREVVKNPNNPWAAKAQARLQALDQAPPPVEKRAGLFGPAPVKTEDSQLRTGTDAVVPLPVPAPVELPQ